MADPAAPLLLIGFLWWRLSKGASGRVQGALGAGRSKAKVFDEERPEDEVRRRGGLRRRQARDPRGRRLPPAPRALCTSRCEAATRHPDGRPPGTGKTLLARAVAGEAEVPFFSVTGSSFVEMFVGVGAARVRDLFEEARKRAPAIIFVDEIDAIGQRRGGAGAIVSNDEREQTLNQLLAEMDGFDPATGIVVLAATNRPEVLDPALLRPGRFDRQVTIPLPTLPERLAILQVHCHGQAARRQRDLEVVARGTPGFSGADLANLVNEAAIVAVRDNREVIKASDFDEARDRIILGRREGSNVLFPEEKHAVAIHEAGHALVAAYSEKADPIAKVTILPAGQALGRDRAASPGRAPPLRGGLPLRHAGGVLGGRASELVVLGQGSTGASNDLAKATELAIKMVREFGLSRTSGRWATRSGGSVFLGRGR